jgi:hypothetical protein
MVVLTKTVTVSAKVPEELRRKMADLGIVPSDVIRRAIEAAVREREREQLLKRAESWGE